MNIHAQVESLKNKLYIEELIKCSKSARYYIKRLCSHRLRWSMYHYSQSFVRPVPLQPTAFAESVLPIVLMPAPRVSESPLRGLVTRLLDSLRLKPLWKRMTAAT